MRRAETLYSQQQYEPAAKWFASAAASKDFKMADLAALRQAQSPLLANNNILCNQKQYLLQD